MANETNAQARTPQPGGPSEDDYRTFCDALTTSARGRAFLAEYARRNRHADTEILLAALARLEARLRADGSAQDRLRGELRMLLIAIRLARPELDGASPTAKAAKLAALVELLERRIDAMVEAKPDEKPDEKPAELAPPADDMLGAHAMPEQPAEAVRAHLAVVPPPEQPELPIPSPASAQPPPIALVHDLRTAATMPEVAFVASARPAVIEQPAATAPPAPAAVEINAPAPKAALGSPAADPLAAIMALSEDERLALFT